jgi:hypothetical protein
VVSTKAKEVAMNVMIGIDPHKASHTAVAIDGDEAQIAAIKVRATLRQVDQLVSGVVREGPDCELLCRCPRVVSIVGELWEHEVPGSSPGAPTIV